jgi:5-formyltetrahydrofolate cyclo-ligase
VAIPDPSIVKSALRSSMRKLLRENPADSQAVCEALHVWLNQHTDMQIIAVFSPLPGEVDLTNFVSRHPEIQWCYPRVEGETLTFHCVTDPLSELQAGHFHILEPISKQVIISLIKIDAFICPGLAFHADGGRLGRGKGFYDRILTQARPDAIKIGVCFPEQLIVQTFSESHDIPMDSVITG